MSKPNCAALAVAVREAGEPLTRRASSALSGSQDQDAAQPSSRKTRAMARTANSASSSDGGSTPFAACSLVLPRECRMAMVRAALAATNFLRWIARASESGASSLRKKPSSPALAGDEHADLKRRHLVGSAATRTPPCVTSPRLSQ